MNFAINEAAILMSQSYNESSPAYLEAVECLESTSSPKGEKFKEALLSAILKDYGKVAAKNPEIAVSKGSIVKFKGYATIEKCLASMTGSDVFEGIATGKSMRLTEYDKNFAADLNRLRRYVKDNVAYYTQAYTAGNKILQCEYECNVFLLATMPAAIISKSMSGMEYTAREKTAYGKVREYIRNVCSAEHTKMMKTVLFDNHDEAKPVSESVDLVKMDTYQESIIGTVALIAGAVVTLLVGIRFITWMIFKVRTNISDALDVQREFLEANVKRLKNRKDIPEEQKEKIISKQIKWINTLSNLAEKFRVKFNVNVPDSAPMPEKPKDDPAPKSEPKSKPKDDDDGFLI